MKIETYKCDGCGVTKGESNHWYSMLIDWGRKLALVQPIGTEWQITQSSYGSCQGLGAMQAMQTLVTQQFDLCGQDCVNRKLAEVLAQQTKESR